MGMSKVATPRRITVGERGAEKKSKTDKPSQDCPDIVRIAVNGWTYRDCYTDNTSDVRDMLMEAFDSWPCGMAKFTVTPGGFIQTPIPEDCLGSSGWDSNASDFEALKPVAYGVVDKVLSKALLKKAKKCTQFLSLGVDLSNYKDYRGERKIDIHAELVAIVDVRSENVLPKDVHWTGKSYPVAWQEHKLVHAPLESHKFIFGGEKVLVLGCHDLNMFSNRSYKMQKLGGRRQRITDRMRKMARGFNPTVVLHHPHTTYSPRIWQTAWAGIREHVPTANTGASGIAFCGKKNEEKYWNCFQTLAKTLAATKFGKVCDLEVSGYECENEKGWLKWAERIVSEARRKGRVGNLKHLIRLFEGNDAVEEVRMLKEQDEGF